MSVSDSTLKEIASSLEKAEKTCEPIAPLTETHPNLTLGDAYRIQELNHTHLIQSGRKVLGHKIGLTSKEAQDMIGISHPDFGLLFDHMEVPTGGSFELAKLIQPKIEGEIAFRLGRALKGPGVTAEDVSSCISEVMVSMEIVDSRVRDWKIRAVDTIADNASSALYVLGEPISPAGLDLRHIGMLLTNGKDSLTGSSAAVMENPLNAVAYLANELGEQNKGLEKDQIILSGSLAAMLPIKKGDRFKCEMQTLGAVEISFD